MRAPSPTALALALLAAHTSSAWSQTSVPLADTVVITAERSRQSSFDAPAAITTVTRDVIEAGGRYLVGLSR